MLNMMIFEKKLNGENLVESGVVKINRQIEARTNNRPENHSTNKPTILFNGVPIPRKPRTRFVLKRGLEKVSVLLEHIVFFYTDNRITYAIDHTGTKYIADINLSELEKELGEAFFFRSNRQFIININHIRSFRSHEREN